MPYLKCLQVKNKTQFLAAQTWEELHGLPEPALSWAGDWDYELGGKSLAKSSVNSGFLFLENCITEVAVFLNEQDLNLSCFTESEVFCRVLS
jgi:hypothetical protein